MMFGFVDCNNFYASCERAFRPDWRHLPVVVLSNNDGCIVARSDEVKKLGYQLGASYFKVRDQLDRDGVVVRSSNYALYGDLSQRVMECLESLAPTVEVYSIDEAFLDVRGVRDLEAYGHEVVRTVKQWTSIPVSVGIAPTKTLAKIANRQGKKLSEAGNVFVMTPSFCLKQEAVEGVWGVGRRLARRLRLMGIGTAQDLADLDYTIARKKFGVTLERTVRELRGESCLPMEEILPDAQHLMVSRGFKGRITSKHHLEEAVATYASQVAEKARVRGVYAAAIHVFIRTSPFNKGAHYVNNASRTFLDPCNDSLTLVKAAMACLDAIWKDGYFYQKAGVLLTDLSNERQRPSPLLERNLNESIAELMQALDRINQRYGRETLRVATSGTKRPWMMAREFLSPSYTTRWEDIPGARA